MFGMYLILSISRVLMQWDRFTCARPVHVWFLVHQLITLCMFLGHTLAHRIQEQNTGPQLLLPISGNRRQKAVSIFILVVLVPAFIASDALGLFWFLGSQNSVEQRCWPSDVVNDPEVVTLVLFGGCFWAAIYVLFGVSLLLQTCAPRRARALARGLSGAGMAQQRSFSRSAALPLSTLLDHCPEASCESTSTVYCSICLDSVQSGQQIRTIVVCGHQYHSDCLEEWLRNRPVCPNCQQDVTTPVV